MTPEQQLLKDTGDLLREVIEVLIGNNLEMVKKYSLIEERIKKQLGEPSGKPSLFDAKGNSPAEAEKPLPEKPVVVQPAEKKYPDPPEKVITDPLKKISSSFPDGDPRSGVPREKLIEEAGKSQFPWETGTEQLGLKTPPPKPVTPVRHYPITDDLPF